MNAQYNKNKVTRFTNFPMEEEHSKEKDTEGKCKQEEGKILYNLVSLNGLSSLDGNTFYSYRSQLNIDPYQDDDIQPPKAV